MLSHPLLSPKRVTLSVGLCGIARRVLGVLDVHSAQDDGADVNPYVTGSVDTTRGASGQLQAADIVQREVILRSAFRI